MAVMNGARNGGSTGGRAARAYNPRSVPRGSALALLVLLLLLSALPAAAANIETTTAADGTLVLVGSGWRPGDRLVLALGQDVFAAQADPAGGFEVATTVPASSGLGANLVVRRAPRTLAFAPLFEDDAPHPFAVLFARGLATGAGLLAAAAAVLGIGALAMKPLRRGRSSRP
jgi:hypothetical protein